MEEKDSLYKTEHRILVVILVVFLVLSAIWTAYSVIANFGHVVKSSVSAGIPYIFNILTVIAIIIYSVFGYKRKPVYYNACITLFEFSVVADIVHFASNLDDETHLITNKYGVACIVFSIAALIVEFAYANVYKKNKGTALLLAGILFVGELAYSVAALLVTLKLYGDIFTVFKNQVFVHFFTSTALTMSYAVRTHWSISGKPDKKDVADAAI